MTYRMPLYRRSELVGFTLLDESDAAWLKGWRWTIDKSNYVVRYEYVRGSGKKNEETRCYRLHRLVMELGPWREDRREVDHINRDRLDNRKANLRVVTHAQQAQNRRKTRNWRGPASSRYRGVAWSAHAKRWTIRVWHEGKNINGGYFDSEDEANQAVIAMRKRLMPYATY
jgi:hypothetical protein